jgi:hypothetical protein
VKMVNKTTHRYLYKYQLCHIDKVCQNDRYYSFPLRDTRKKYISPPFPSAKWYGNQFRRLVKCRLQLFLQLSPPPFRCRLEAVSLAAFSSPPRTRRLLSHFDAPLPAAALVGVRADTQASSYPPATLCPSRICLYTTPYAFCIAPTFTYDLRAACYIRGTIGRFTFESL